MNASLPLANDACVQGFGAGRREEAVCLCHRQARYFLLANASRQLALEGEEVRWGWGECIQPQQGEAPAAAIDALSRCARSLVTAHCATCMIERLSALLSDKTINVNSTD